ncbi:MAG: protein-glutamate O-methyltransferase CheR [Magnetococcales bacterium]|nr:protein-glutamate O-methyltransferase CheR [Magnetococcales bacterium]
MAPATVQSPREHWLDALIGQVWETTRCDLGRYDHTLLRRRIAERIAETALAGPQDYLTWLQQDAAECRQLVNLMAVQVSAFFRNPVVFELIDQQVLPELIARKQAHGQTGLRVWSAGCCSGEEAYTIAMLIHRQLQDRAGHVFATDIHPDTLEYARAGIYPPDRLDAVKLGLLKRYFVPHGQDFQVDGVIRDMVHFSYHDLTIPDLGTPTDSVFGTFDLILCRNVLIYFSPEHRRHILRQLHDSLDRGGYLVLGEAEFLAGDMEARFDAMDRRNRIFRKR